jgi:YfiH family protein
MIEAPELQLPGIKHGFATREGGYSDGLFSSLNCGFGSGDDKQIVAKNRARVADVLGVAKHRLLTVWQWHSADAVEARESWDVLQPPKGDAIVTNVPGLALGVLTADCAPVLFADAAAQVIGAAHAGWKGALTGVTDSTIAAMEKLGAKRENIVAMIGPTISKSAYEVGPEFSQRFLETEESNAEFFKPSERATHSFFNLPGYLLKRLGMAGVKKARDLQTCTYSDEQRFFSFRRTTHRKEADYGRQISTIALCQ